MMAGVNIHPAGRFDKTTPGHDALWGARNAQVTLLAGFTTCREMGPAWPYVDVDLRNAIDAGAVPGPRLIVAGSYVSSTGGAGDAKQFSIYGTYTIDEAAGTITHHIEGSLTWERVK